MTIIVIHRSSLHVIITRASALVVVKYKAINTTTRKVKYIVHLLFYLDVNIKIEILGVSHKKNYVFCFILKMRWLLSHMSVLHCFMTKGAIVCKLAIELHTFNHFQSDLFYKSTNNIFCLKTNVVDLHSVSPFL